MNTKNTKLIYIIFIIIAFIFFTGCSQLNDKTIIVNVYINNVKDKDQVREIWIYTETHNFYTDSGKLYSYSFIKGQYNYTFEIPLSYTDGYLDSLPCELQGIYGDQSRKHLTVDEEVRTVLDKNESFQITF